MMKKRLIAFLLVLIMVLGMLPVSALAADGDATKYTYTLYYKWNNGTDSTWSTEVTDRPTAATTFTFYVNGAKLTRDGYTFLGWADTADATTASYKGGDPIVLDKDNPTKTIFAVWEKNVAPIEYTVTYYKNDGSENDLFYKTDDWGRPSEQFNIYWGKPTRDGYDFVGWAERRDAKEAKYASGGAGGKQSWIKLDGPKVLYAVWQEAGLEPEAPRSPSDCKDQLKKNTIKLVCVGGNHPDKVITFADVSYGSDWSMGDTCKLNFYAKDAALKYSGHAPKNPEERIYVTFKWVNDKTDANGKYLPGEWVMVETTAAVVELVDTGVEAPSKPTTAQLGNIKVTCRTNAAHSSEFPVASCMGTIVGTVTFDSVKKQWYIDTAPMTTQLASRYDFWKGYAEGTHRLVNPDAKLNARFYYDGEKWYTEDTLAIDVCCGETPVKPTALDGSFAIVCKNNKATHPHKADYIATPSQYTISDVQMDDQGYYVTATVTVAPNLAAYNTATRVEHRLVNEQDATLTITFRYDPKATGKWTQQGKQQGELPVVEVICKVIEAPTREDIFGALNGLVTVTCINRFWKDGNNNMDCGQGQYAAKAGIVGQDYTLVKGEDAGTWVVTFPVTNFVKSFKQNPAHHLYTGDTLSWYIRWEDNAWTSAPVKPGVDDLVKLTHAPTDWREVAKIATGGKSDCIHTHCVNSGLNVCDYGITVPFVNFKEDVVSVVPEAGVPGSYIATFRVDKFVDARAKVCNDKNFPDAPRTHKLLTQETVQWRLYATDKADEKIGSNVPNHVWEAEPVKAGKDDVCTIAHNWVVTFNPNGGTPVPLAQEVEYGHTATKPVEPTLKGYTFDGWYLDGEEEPFDFGTTITSDITLTAKWNINKYTVTFNSYGGTPVPPAQEVEYGLTATKPADPTLKGYTFAFWYLGEDEQNATAYDFDTPVTENITLTAKWNINKYTVTFNSYGGTPVPPAQEVEYGLTATKPADPTLKGYTFAFWYLGEDEQNATAYDFDTPVTENITLTAKWNINKYTVAFNTDGGTPVPPAQEVEYGLTATEPAAPEKTGYTFDGWYLGDEKYDFSAAVEQNITLTANWEKKTYKVVAKLYVNGKPAYYQNEDFYTYEVSGLYGEAIDFDTIKAKAVEQAKQIKKASASYTAVILEDHEPNPVCTTFGEHQPGQATHYVKVNVKTEENVVIFQSFEGKTDLTKLHTTTAPYGTNVVEFLNDLGLDLEVAGYTLDTDEDGNTNWYKKDSPKWTFGANDTINGWTNVLLKYTVTPHNIYAYARLNSYFAPLTNVEFDEYVKLNAATLERLGLGSYNANDFISIGKFSFNQLPLTEDLYFGDDAELDAVAAELAKSIALETGVSKETAEKIAWTVLFKTENEEDMAPGYPAEDGYQLSGNLNLASVTFRAGAENVENMPAVNYTYDDGAIDFYDFYFAGDTITMPADPTRAKYTFMGWKAQVLPAEDDLDVYTDGAETDEGATLYRAGDTYTITDGGVIFTAQWELTATPIGDIYVRYDVLHIKQLPDGTYDLANAEVEHLSAKKDTTVTAVAKNYSATHHFFNSKLGTLTGTAIQPYKGVDGKPVYTILTVYYDLDFHTLTFDTMGGSKIAPETVRHGLTVAKPKDPVNGGYIFDGWYTDKTFRHRYDFSTPLTEDITIYAKWFLIVLPGVTVKKNTPKLNTADHFAYVQGYPDGTVKPAGNITRAETAAILFRLMDDASRKTYYSTKSGFRDVASGSWYNTYVATLNNAGVITDSSNGYFRPNEAITRAELAAMLAKFSETTGAANYFNDVSAKYWAANAIAICAKLGWINGYPDGTFRPDKNVTRAELMAMINRATGRAPKSADAFLPGMKTWIDNTSDKWYYLDVQEATNSHSYTVKGSETWTALTSDPNWSLYE